MSEICQSMNSCYYEHGNAFNQSISLYQSILKSLWHGCTIWRPISWSILVRVLHGAQYAPNYCLNSFDLFLAQLISYGIHIRDKHGTCMYYMQSSIFQMRYQNIKTHLKRSNWIKRLFLLYYFYKIFFEIWSNRMKILNKIHQYIEVAFQAKSAFLTSWPVLIMSFGLSLKDDGVCNFYEAIIIENTTWTQFCSEPKHVKFTILDKLAIHIFSDKCIS